MSNEQAVELLSITIKKEQSFSIVSICRIFTDIAVVGRTHVHKTNKHPIINMHWIKYTSGINHNVVIFSGMNVLLKRL